MRRYARGDDGRGAGTMTVQLEKTNTTDLPDGVI